MTEELLQPLPRPPLPEPQRERWQPLRIGLVDLFHYDSEEFWFHDGHLLLRGNNGTGKSKVLSLTLPLLFDAQLRPSRVEPDGDNGKKMAWNLLLGSYPRRIGYSWAEFGRRDRDGRTHYVTLGVGLSAVAGRAQVESWYFLLEGDDQTPGPRLGEDLWLTTTQRAVLTRDRLREAIVGRGQIFENAQSYRRAVDERLFHLGPRRYDALMDTLIQLRQPQLSKKPDETGLSNALSESLPPLPTELLGDVAEALQQLEEDHRQLDEARKLEQAVSQFERRYRLYAGMLARRQARELRQAQTGFDNASEKRNQAQVAQKQADQDEAAAGTAHEAAKQAWIAARERVETLQSDPANQDANRLSQAEQDARQWGLSAADAAKECEGARRKRQEEADRGRGRRQQAEVARNKLEEARNRAIAAAEAIGTSSELAENPLVEQTVEDLARASRTQLEAAAKTLRATVLQRRQDIAHLRQRHAAVDNRRVALDAAQETVLNRRAELEEALEQRTQADQRAERQAETLADDWSGYCAGLTQLGFDAAEPLRRLTEWAVRPEGGNPAQLALFTAYQAVVRHQAARQAQIDAQREAQRRQRAELEAERERLAGGEDAVPPAPSTRAPAVRAQRQGAPLWRLVDFQAHLGATERAGLEAALEASGLLDAWLAPDGALTDDEGRPLLDTTWSPRAPVAGASLNDALTPALPDGCPISETTLAAVLAGVAYGLDDPGRGESWLSPQGRFRLGALAGAWDKPEAVYIGHTARERARLRRLAEIATAIAELEAAEAEIGRQGTELDAARRVAEQEWRDAPSDRALHEAIAAAVSAGREADRARQRLQQADSRQQEAEQTLQAAREQLVQDAVDLRLPDEREHLPAFEQALEAFDQAQRTLCETAREWHRAWPEHLEQQRRENEAQQRLEQAGEALDKAEEQAGQAQARFETLQESIGQQVEALRLKLEAAIERRKQAGDETERRQHALSESSKTHAVATSVAEQAEQALDGCTTARLAVAERLRHFADSELLASALPDLVPPESWSIDPALNLARRIEQALIQVADNDDAWTRMQRQIAEDLTELQRALSALGHQATSEPNDWGFTVHIRYQNRVERPDRLAALLAEDIAQRSELLSAREREVLENHLQAEIAAEIQRLMRAADERVNAINDELHKRPTSTGVRYRLKWEALSAEEGAPAGLEVARERLLNTSSDLWSAGDRRAVGAMLQQQITAERMRSDADTTGSSLIDQLARALDYRYWHRFRILRQQDGQWRKLSGPASSGERALGLTVPLFAAIASFYGHGGSPLAPRLMLLDEAFAGIDDNARAHCMGLIREFDLDFVITSEREWACYAELPGVAICQLQRREGIDAVYVSRWTWDGRAKRPEDDPERRFPPAA